MAWTCLVKCKRKWRWLHDCAEKDGIIKFCVDIGKTTIEMKQMIEKKKYAEMLPGQCLQVGEIFKMKHCTLMHNIQWHVLLFTYARIYMFYCLLTHAYLCSIRLLKTAYSYYNVYLRMHIHDLSRTTEATLTAIVLSEAFRNGLVTGGVNALNGGDLPPITRKQRHKALWENKCKIM